MSLTANKLIVEQFDELLDTGELTRLDVLCTPDLINHTLRPGWTPGLAGTREFLESKLARTQMSDHAWQQLQVVAEGEFVAQFGIRSGRWHGGEFMGVPAAPGTYSRDFAALYRFRDGRITERWAVRDDLGMLRQLGALH